MDDVRMKALELAVGLAVAASNDDPKSVVKSAEEFYAFLTNQKGASKTD